MVAQNKVFLKYSFEIWQCAFVIEKIKKKIFKDYLVFTKFVQLT